MIPRSCLLAFFGACALGATTTGRATGLIESLRGRTIISGAMRCGSRCAWRAWLTRGLARRRGRGLRLTGGRGNLLPRDSPSRPRGGSPAQAPGIGNVRASRIADHSSRHGADRSEHHGAG